MLHLNIALPTPSSHMLHPKKRSNGTSSSYAVMGTVISTMYQGSAVGTLVVAPLNQTINFANPGPQFITNKVGLRATASSGLPVNFDVQSGPGTITEMTNLAFTGVGTVVVVASQAGDAVWNPAPNVTNAITVTFENPNKDSDGDGMSDWAEFIAGTDPTNRNSHLRFGFPASGVYAPNDDGIVLQWYSVSNRVYHLNRSTNLNSEFNLLDPIDIPATPSVNVYTDTTATGLGPYFYKVGVEKQP